MAPVPSPHLLIVEDNPDDETLVRRALQSVKDAPTAVVAHDGVEAIEMLKTQRAPHLILLDLMMPRMNGFEFLRFIRGQDEYRHIPIVVFTSSDATRDVRAAYDAGASGYVQKPTDFHDFSSAIKGVIAFWLRLNEPPQQSAERLQRLL